ncbi:hypothetical protein JMK10_07385 [Rhodovulum sulfidophilum]|uniref:hypothetical protein n=1 Tax=Rhodovulum sulfidophilum TaxID=35806 RepID=UPI0019210535|nr:hypothetical protein [Rhodovulum sulfidophilum]MBL3572557.1 hypothetical protein [Rhodovulum sulfidophilum]MCE8432925.1 hypothetical protein [Rhodovulum sulfidophilum]MCF4116634.1 hypothetical protein [Rhodovulum sulfidophilum]
MTGLRGRSLRTATARLRHTVAVNRIPPGSSVSSKDLCRFDNTYLTFHCQSSFYPAFRAFGSGGSSSLMDWPHLRDAAFFIALRLHLAKSLHVDASRQTS